MAREEGLPAEAGNARRQRNIADLIEKPGQCVRLTVADDFSAHAQVFSREISHYPVVGFTVLPFASVQSQQLAGEGEIPPACYLFGGAFIDALRPARPNCYQPTPIEGKPEPERVRDCHLRRISPFEAAKDSPQGQASRRKTSADQPLACSGRRSGRAPGRSRSLMRSPATLLPGGRRAITSRAPSDRKARLSAPVGSTTSIRASKAVPRDRHRHCRRDRLRPDAEQHRRTLDAAVAWPERPDRQADIRLRPAATIRTTRAPFSSSRTPGTRFIDGEPMKPATKRFAGRS